MTAEPYRILVTGSRDWPDGRRNRVGATLASIVIERGWNVVVVHGGCPTGADAFASAYVRKVAELLAQHKAEGSVTEEVHPADWATHGKSAGFRRNAEMVAAGADICLAFIRNGSKGATHTADLAEKAGIPTRRYLA
jgi:hypothetical protein